MANSSSRETHQAHSIPELRLAMELQQGNIVVQGLAVVVVMDVGGGHAQGLSPGTAVFPGQIVVAHTHIDGIPGSNNAEEVNITDVRNILPFS